MLRRRRLVRGGRARQAGAGRLSRGGAAARRRARACAAVEDSSNGLRAAHAAGMRVIAFPNAHYPPAPTRSRSPTSSSRTSAELTPDARARIARSPQVPYMPNDHQEVDDRLLRAAVPPPGRKPPRGRLPRLDPLRRLAGTTSAPRSSACSGGRPEEWQAHDAPWGTTLHEDDPRGRTSAQEEEALETGFPPLRVPAAAEGTAAVVWIRDEATLARGERRAAVAWNPHRRHRAANARATDSASRRSSRQSASLPAGSRTTSTTCSSRSAATENSRCSGQATTSQLRDDLAQIGIAADRWRAT